MTDASGERTPLACCFRPLAEKLESHEKRDFQRCLQNAEYPKELFGEPPNRTRGPRMLPRSHAKPFWINSEFISLMVIWS